MAPSDRERLAHLADQLAYHTARNGMLGLWVWFRLRAWRLRRG